MSRLTEFVRRGAKGAFGVQSVAKGSGGYFGSGFGTYGSTEQQSFNRDAGLRYDNSIVYAAIQYTCKSLAEVEIVHERPSSDGTYKEVKNSPISDLLRNPNDWYGMDTLISGWVVSELAGPTGMSHTFKHRSGRSGMVVALEYVPHFSVTPFTLPGPGSPWLSFYQISLNGGYRQVLPEDMLVQRFGIIDPLKPQQSFGPLQSCLAEVVSDNEASAYTAALLANSGATAHAFFPPMGPNNTPLFEMTADQASAIKTSWLSSVRKGNRGMPMVFSLPLDVQDLCMDPTKLNLEAIRNINEQRVSAAIGIDVRALNLGSGLQEGNNRASASASFKEAARSYVKPIMARKGRELTDDLVPELGSPGDRIRFKWEEIEALQEDKKEVAERDEKELSYKTVNEKRIEKGLGTVPEGDVILGILKAQKGGGSEKDDADATKEQK